MVDEWTVFLYRIPLAVFGLVAMAWSFREYRRRQKAGATRSHPVNGVLRSLPAVLAAILIVVVVILALPTSAPDVLVIVLFSILGVAVLFGFVLLALGGWHSGFGIPAEPPVEPEQSADEKYEA